MKKMKLGKQETKWLSWEGNEHAMLAVMGRIREGMSKEKG